MKKKIFIHTGLGRTGTTWLQNRIFPCIKDINFIGKREDYYPEWLIKWHYLDNIGFEKEIDDIKECFVSRLLDERVNLLSSEAFTGIGGNFSVQIDRIKRIVPNAKAVIVLRDPLELIYSFYKNNVLSGEFFEPLEELIDWKRTPFVFYKRKPVYLPDYFYNDILNYYKKVFGKENICILYYEDLLNNPLRFFEKLEEFLGVPIPKLLIERNLSERVNRSMGEANISKKRRKNLLARIEKLFPYEHPEFTIDKVFEDSSIMNDGLRRKIAEYLGGKADRYY